MVGENPTFGNDAAADKEDVSQSNHEVLKTLVQEWKGIAFTQCLLRQTFSWVERATVKTGGSAMDQSRGIEQGLQEFGSIISGYDAQPPSVF